MQINTQKNKSTLELDEYINFLKGLLYGALIPLFFTSFIGLWGYLFLLIPIAAYSTIAKERESILWFYIFAGFLIVMAVSSFADGSLPQ